MTSVKGRESMIQKKICMLGGFAVGKTSLVRQFVESIYSDKYHTTVGVKIDKKLVTAGDQEINLLLWDIQGEDGVQKLRSSYLRGAAGYLLVIDSTRGTTLDTACAIQQSAQELLGLVPLSRSLTKSILSMNGTWTKRRSKVWSRPVGQFTGRVRRPDST